MKQLFLCTLMTLLLASQVEAATRYVAQNGNDANDCNTSQSVNFPKLTFASAVACINAGDTLYIRGGTWTTQLDFQLGNKTGTASAWITVSGYPGETVILRYNNPTVGGYGPIKARGNRGYFIFENLVIDGTDTGDATSWSLRDGNHHFIVRDIEMRNIRSTGLFMAGPDLVVQRVKIHDSFAHATSRRYGIYYSQGDRGVIENCEIYNQPGGGITVFPGPIANAVIRNNKVHHNNFMNSPQAGIDIFGDIDYYNGAKATDIQVYGNLVYENGLSSLHANPSGIRVGNSSERIKLWNNTIYGNKGYGILIQAGDNGAPLNTEIRNNILTGNTVGQYLNAGTGTTITHSACLAGDACGTTGKVTLSSNTEPFVDQENDDYRLKQGANAVRDAGTATLARPAPVGVTDIGAYEQGAIVSAVVAGSHIEATVNAVSGIQPGAGLTGLSLECVTCTGTPVLLANPKAGSTNTIQISVYGLTGSGTARLNLGATNITDGNYVGLPSSAGSAQGLNSLSALDITGTVDNTSGDPTPPAGGLYSEFLLDDGSGEVATDNTINGNDGTVSTGVTWVNNTSGTGVYIPTAEEAGDSTYRHVASTHGSGVNLTDNSLSTCALVLPDTQYAQKVPLSAGANSPGRFYIGWFTVGGAKYWGTGIGASTMSSTGVSEFPLLPKLTLICLRANAATNTAVLSVDRSIGTSAAAVKSIPSFALPDNIRAGNDGTNTINTGGVTVYGKWVWNNTYLSDAEVISLYDSLFPAGGSVGGYAEVTHRWQKVYLNGTSNPDNYLDIGTEEVEVMENGAVVIEKEVGCSGGPCGPVAFRLYVSDLAGNEAPVPQEIGAGGIGMWGDSNSNILNRGVSTCCLTEGGTPVHGVTILDSVATNTVELCDGCKTMFRWVLKVGSANNTHILTIKQDNGAPLDGVAGTTPRIKVVPARASGVR